MPLDPRRKTAKFNFGLNGMISKENPTLLTDGQYRSCADMEVVQEGALATRAGKLLLGDIPNPTTECYMIQKFLVAPGDSPYSFSGSPNYRYLGVVNSGSYNLVRTQTYATSSFTTVATGINSSGGYEAKAFKLATYAAGEVGGAWAFIASEKLMLKDQGISPYSTLRQWGIKPAFGVATAVATGTVGAGKLDSTANGATNYNYRYTYLATDTNNEGNPSQTMLSDSVVANGQPAAANKQVVAVTGYGTDDPQVSTINIYRQGGLLFDAWRFVGQVPNPGLGSMFAFNDNVADTDLVYAKLLSTDNDPPVPSTVQNPATAGGTIPATSAGRQTVTLLTGSVSSLTPGTQIQCIWDFPETVTVESVSGGGTTFTAYFQYNQPVNTTVFASAICGQPCTLVIAYQQFLIVAGDPNNPHLLYRSIGDSPEYFPVAPADGSVATAAAGSPSNPIMNLYEYRGQILTLNLYAIFESMIYSGSLVNPAKMADKGTVGRRANCKTDTEIWFLANDGVWSWDGAQCRKRSESIDPIFHGEEINGILPLDYTHPELCVMESRRNQVYLLYRDIAGNYQEIICEPLFNDRWRKSNINTPEVGFLYTETDSGAMIEVSDGTEVLLSLVDQYVVSGGVNYCADYYTSSWVPPATSNGGQAIAFDMWLPWFDMGTPASKKLFEEVFLELDTSNQYGAPTYGNLTVELLVDFSDTAVDTLTVTVPDYRGRAIISLLPALATVSAQVQSYGRDARAISCHIYGKAWPAQILFYGMTLVYQDTEMLTSGGNCDWMDLGYPHDKKLYQMVVEFDSAGVNQTLVIDTMAGVDGKTYTPAVQSFVLTNTLYAGAGLNGQGTARAKKSFPIADGTIVKLVRVRPYADTTVGAAAVTFFEIFSVAFEKEDYPPDIVSFTKWEDDGYPFLKYINQATLSVNTNNVGVTVQIQADGATVATEVVTSTDSDRIRNLTIPSGITGRQWRLYVDTSQTAIASGGGVFQLWNDGKIFRFQPADRGEVGHTFDWDDLGHQWDKYLRTVTVEWDDTGGSNVTLQLDTISGIGGQTVTTNVASFTLSGGRSKATFPLPVDTIAKMIRLYPSTTPPVTFRQWKYSFDKIDYPADIIYSTEWRDAASPNDKNPSWISIDADTQSVACSVSLYNENGSVLIVSHTGSVDDRMKNYPIPADIFAKMWRLLAAPGANGKFQLFNWSFSRWQPTPDSSPTDPPDTVTWAPWKEAESPTDKNPSWMFVDADTGGVAASVVLQSNSGDVMTVSHTGTSTSRVSLYPIPVDTFAKMWRIRSAPGGGGKFKLWDWGFSRWQPTPQTSPTDPPDVVLWTPWNDFEWPYDKIGRNLILTIDTGSIACSVQVQTENGTVQTFSSVTTSYTTRRVVLPMNSNLIGKMWRLVNSPGSNGKAKLWEWGMDVVKEPAAVNYWDSYQQTLGYAPWKVLIQIFLEYQCAGQVTLQIVSDTGTFSITLPAHATRASERFLLPTVFGAGLNKSKIYEFILNSVTSTSPFKVYAESWIEWVPQGEERHAGYRRTPIREIWPLEI